MNLFNKILIIVFLFLSVGGYSQDYYQTVKGTILEESTGKPIKGASIKVIDKNIGTFSDSLGQYTLKVAWQEYPSLIVSSVGFYPVRKVVPYIQNLILDFKLKEDVRLLEEALISAKKSDAVTDNNVGKIQVNLQNLKNMPMAFGQADVLKAIILNAGVSTIGEGAGGFNVRGGRVDQNLVLYDDAPLFNTSHLLGFFSVINSETLQGVELYKAFIPAGYGGRLSSLLILEPKTGNVDKPKGSLSVGVVSSNFNVDGALSKNQKIQYSLGGRIAYPNLAIGMFPSPTNKSKAFFYDFNGNVSYKLSLKDNIRFSFLNSFDSFKFPQDTSYFWKSQAYTLSYSHAFSNKFTFFLKGIQSKYTLGLKGLTDYYDYTFSSKLIHQEIKSDFIYNNNWLVLNSGASVIGYTFAPGQITPNSEKSIIAPVTLAQNHAREMAGFANFDMTFSKRISLQVGTRYSIFQALGSQNVYIYTPNIPKSIESITDTLAYKKGEIIKTYHAFEPRISAKIGLGKNTSLKLSYNVTQQYLHLISNTTAISPLDFWKGSDTYIPPQSGKQYSLGLFKNLKENTFETSVEVYYKAIQNMIEYKNGANLFLNSTLETDLLPAIGKAYGIELSVKKKRGFFTGSLAYTYSRTFAKVANDNKLLSINNGNWFASNYDRPHNLSLNGQWALAHHWNFSFNFVYISGRPITYPDGQYTLFGTPVINYYYRNMARIPDTHRLDLFISKDLKANKSQKRYSTVGFSLYNVYARKNAYSIYFERFNSVVFPKQLSVLGAAIPSLNYTYNF